MLELSAIIAAGVAAYQASLPDYARDAAPIVTLPDHARDASELPEPQPNLTLDEDRQRALCLECPLADCVGIENAACPIRREQRAHWRRNRKSQPKTEANQ